MIRPFCIKELHTRCRHDSSNCECLCHTDNGNGVPADNDKPSPSILNSIYQILEKTAEK